MSDNEKSIPVYQTFKGKTVGELVKFLDGYPGDMPMQFTDGDLLTVRAKGPDLIMRLDPKEEHAD